MDEQTKKSMCGISERALEPLINERDEEVRDIAIKKIGEDAIGKQHAGRGHKEKITGKEVVKALAKASCACVILNLYNIALTTYC
jgi:hypothetical protein